MIIKLEGGNKTKLLNVGYFNSINKDRVVSVADYESAPIKKLVKNARDMGMLVDLTQGKKTRAVIVMDSSHIVLTSKSAESLAKNE